MRTAVPTPDLSAAAVYRDAHRALEAAVTGGPGTTFGLEDLAPRASWDFLIAAGYGLALAAGALSGALAGLRRRGVSVADVLGCPAVHLGGGVEPRDMRLAAAWLADGIARDDDPDLDDIGVDVIGTDVLWSAGTRWDGERIAAVVFAIAGVAGHAAAQHRL